MVYISYFKTIVLGDGNHFWKSPPQKIYWNYKCTFPTGTSPAFNYPSGLRGLVVVSVPWNEWKKGPRS